MNLQMPPGMPVELQRKGLDTLGRVNAARFNQVHDEQSVNRRWRFAVDALLRGLSPRDDPGRPVRRKT